MGQKGEQGAEPGETDRGGKRKLTLQGNLECSENLGTVRKKADGAQLVTDCLLGGVKGQRWAARCPLGEVDERTWAPNSKSSGRGAPHLRNVRPVTNFTGVAPGVAQCRLGRCSNWQV